MRLFIWQRYLPSALLLTLALCAGCATVTRAPKPPSTSSVFQAKVVSEHDQPIYDSSGSRVSTRINILLRLEDGSTISAYCEGNAFSGLVQPSGWVCRRPEVGGTYQAWWRNNRQIYLMGQSAGGKDLATLFTVTGRSSP